MEERRVTREDFDKAVDAAQKEFTEISLSKDETPEGAFTVMVMGLQNAAFSALIYKHLFGI